MQKGEFRSPVSVLLLSIITCGIYNLYWIYKTSDETQKYLGRVATTPTAELLLCMFTCGIYYIYWNYKYGKVINECQQQAGLPIEDNSVLLVILAIFGLGVVNSIIMQSSMNKIWETTNAGW